MRNENAQYFFIFALFSVLGSFPEGKPTTEPGKATNSQAISCASDTPCHVEVNGKNLTISLNGTRSSDYMEACTETCLTKIACLEKNSMSTKCVNESSTAASCNKNNLDMEYKQTLDGMFTVRVTGLKEQFRNWSRVYIKAEMQGLSPDHLCVYNESASAIRCSSLPAPLNGNKTGCTNITSEPYDAHCNFSCNVGYSLVGSPIRRCLENGTWSGETSHCQDRRIEKSPVLKIVGSLVALFVVVAIIVGWFKFKTRKTRHVTEENVGPDNLAYGKRRRLLDDEFDMGLSQHVQQSDVNIDPERPANLPFSGAIVSRSEIENKESVLDLPNYGDETLNNHPPTSVPKYITRLEDTFTSTGGELSAPLESDVRIIVPSGAIPAGINQSVFFGFFFDETTLLRDIPEAADCSLISPVIQCGPHGIHLLKPVEIIVPHCLDLNEAKKERITVYRCGQFFAQDYLNWEKVPNESEETSQSSQAVFTVKEDAIHIKTKTFSLLSIFACGGPRRKRATVFANRPDSQSDLIYLRFYVYSDNQDCKKRVELAEKERFPGSKPSREKPFRMYKDGRVITVKLTDLEEGWNFDKTKNTQIYGKGRGSGFRSTDACDFAVKPEDGRDVNGFSCNVKFQQEDDDLEHSIYLNPGFTPLKRQRTRQSSLEGDRSDSTSSTSQDWDHYVSTLGSEPVTEEHIYQISPDVGRDWKDVLRSLSLKKKAIENLSADYKYEKITEQCIQGLLKWKELKPESATIKILAGALLRVRCFDALQTLQNSIGNTSDSLVKIRA